MSYNDVIRAHIASHGSRIVRVAAITKDGTYKRFTFNPLGQVGKLSEFVTVQGAQAAATRKANNPDLMNVWDVTHKRWRSFNLSRVVSVKCGAERPFRIYRGAA